MERNQTDRIGNTQQERKILGLSDCTNGLHYSILNLFASQRSASNRPDRQGQPNNKASPRQTWKQVQQTTFIVRPGEMTPNHRAGPQEPPPWPNQKRFLLLLDLAKWHLTNKPWILVVKLLVHACGVPSSQRTRPSLVLVGTWSLFVLILSLEFTSYSIIQQIDKQNFQP
jgi:hypothetical protein